MIGQGITVLFIAKHELALVVGTPESVGVSGSAERGALGLMTSSLPTLNQIIAIKHCVYGADRRWFDHGVCPNQLIADLWCAPRRVFVLDAQK